jgi:hypothetical protein
VKVEAKFNRLRDFLSTLPSQFCLVYRARCILGCVKLKWCKAASQEKMSRHDYDKLASRYHEIALNSYQRNRSYILKEASPPATSKTEKWCGFTVPLPDEAPRSKVTTAVTCRRWWHLVIGTGATREAGYVIVTRVAAAREEDLLGFISTIQEIWEAK